MAAHAPHRVPRSHSLTARLRAVTGRLELDRELAAGTSEPSPPVRSIAAVSLLLTDGTGPVFAPSPHGTLSEVAFQAAFHAEAG